MMIEVSAIDVLAVRRGFKEAEPLSGRKRGQALESLVADVFNAVPGLRLISRNTYDSAGAQEFDLGFRNDRDARGLFDFGRAVLVECKNWDRPVGAAEVGWFVQKLEDARQEIGILVAANGITGGAHDLSSAHRTIDRAKGRHGVIIVVVTRYELERLTSGEALADILQTKLFWVDAHSTVHIADDDELEHANLLAAKPRDTESRGAQHSAEGQSTPDRPSESKLTETGSLRRADQRPTGTRPLLELNAASMSSFAAARGFVPTPAFDRLARPYHSVVVGPRGTGKTMMLRMLDATTQHESMQDGADLIRDRLMFTGVYTSLSPLRAEARNDPSTAWQLVIIRICARFVHAVMHRLSQRSLEDGLSPHAASEKERQIVDRVAAAWGVPLESFAFSELSAALTDQLLELAQVEARSRTGTEIQQMPPLSGTDLVSKLAILTDHCNRALEEPRHLWCALIDDVNAAPPSVVPHLLRLMRSAQGGLLFKFAATPSFVSQFGAGAALSNLGNDYELINAVDGTSSHEFMHAVVRSVLRRRGMEEAPEAVFGWTPGYKPSDFEPRGHAHAAIRRLAERDPSFRTWALARHLLEAEQGRDEMSLALLRKIEPLVRLRDDLMRSFDGVGRGQVRSRKSSQLWTGIPALLRIFDGNVRLLNVFLHRVFDELSADVNIISPRTQTAIVVDMQTEFLRYLKIVPARIEPPQPNVADLVEAIGSGLRRAMQGPFTPDPPLSFTADAEVSEATMETLTAALDAGAIIPVDVGSSHSGWTSEMPRYRLAYLFAPRYGLPLRLGRPVPLSRLLTTSGESAQLDLLDA